MMPDTRELKAGHFSLVGQGDCAETLPIALALCRDTPDPTGGRIGVDRGTVA